MHTCLASFRKNLLVVQLQLFLNVAIREHGFFLLSISQLEIVVVAKAILNRLKFCHLRENLVVVNSLNLSKPFSDKSNFIERLPFR